MCVYEIIQESPGSNIYDSSILFSDDYYNDTGVFTVTFEHDPSNKSSGRIARDVCYLPKFGCFDFDLRLLFFRENFGLSNDAENWVSIPGILDSGIGCSNIGLRLESVMDESKSNFSIENDSTFTFSLIDNKDADCGGLPTEVSFTARKL